MSHVALSFAAPRIEEHELQKELDSMSYEERNQIENDLCGSSRRLVHKNSRLVESSLESSLLQQLDNELQHIPAADRIEYNNALCQCSEYVKSKSFRFMFLRCENYDAKKAASRIVQHWKDKVNIFGETVAYSGRITMNTEEDNKASDNIRILSQTDEAGRKILYSNQSKWSTSSSDSIVKRFWYLIHNALEDDETVQHNGMVLLSCIKCSTHDAIQNRKVDSKINRLLRYSIPVKIMGIHQIFTYDDYFNYSNSESIKLMSSMYLYSLGPELRKRYRKHVGRNCFNLDKYGITKNILPKELGGKKSSSSSTAASVAHLINDDEAAQEARTAAEERLQEQAEIILKPQGSSSSPTRIGGGGLKKKRKTARATEEFLLKERECFSRHSSTGSRSPSPSLSSSSSSDEQMKKPKAKLVSIETNDSLGLLARCSSPVYRRSSMAAQADTKNWQQPSNDSLGMLARCPSPLYLSNADTKNWQQPDGGLYCPPSPPPAAKRQRSSSSPSSSPLHNNTVIYTATTSTAQQPKLQQQRSPSSSSNSSGSNNEQQYKTWLLGQELHLRHSCDNNSN